jgi:predicted PurR-regulated permease PerM
MDKRYILVKKFTVYVIFFLVTIFALIEAQQFLAPLVLAALFSYLLYPIGNFLEKHGLPRILANLVCILAAAGIVTGVVYFFSHQVSIFVEDFPEMKQQAVKNIKSVEEWVVSTFGLSREGVRGWLDDRLSDLGNSGGAFKTAFRATSNTIVIMGLMPVYIFFMLYYRSKFYEFVLRLVPDKEAERTEDILIKVNKVAEKYMTGVFIVVLILSVVHSVGLSIIGLKYPILLGVTAALFNFIPYFGTLIGALLPLLFSLLAMDSLSYTLWVAIYFLIAQFIENNILTPNITGGIVRLNPLVTILSLIVGSMVWGVVGMFVIVPVMAMFRIFCEHITFLKPISFLLSNRGTEKYAITWDKIKSTFGKNK